MVWNKNVSSTLFPCFSRNHQPFNFWNCFIPSAMKHPNAHLKLDRWKGKLAILDFCFKLFCKLYSWDIHRGMEGVWISTLGPESQKLCHLSAKPLHFCFENSQFQISLKNHDFQICSGCCKHKCSALSAAGALLLRKNNYDLVLVSVSDVIFEQLQTEKNKKEIQRGRCIKLTLVLHWRSLF